jgi:hypothetical protein
MSNAAAATQAATLPIFFRIVSVRLVLLRSGKVLTGQPAKFHHPKLLPAELAPCS